MWQYIIKKLDFNLVYLCALLVWMCTTHVQCPWMQKRVSGPLELQLQAAMNSPVWGWELNLDPLQRQELLTTKTRFTSPISCLSNQGPDRAALGVVMIAFLKAAFLLVWLLCVQPLVPHIVVLDPQMTAFMSPTLNFFF